MIASPDLTIRTGDTLPFVQQYLKNRDGTTFVIPVGTTVEFLYRTFAIPMDLVEVAGLVVTAATGLVRAQLNPVLPIAPGRYQAFWRLTLSTGDVISFPDGAYLWMQVTPE